MPVQLLLQPLVLIMQAHPLAARAVVVDHGRRVEGYEDFVAQGLVDLSVGDVGRVYGAGLAPLLDDEVDAPPRAVSPPKDLPPAHSRTGEKVKLKVLGALLPADAVAALLPVEEHPPVAENVLQGAQRLAPGLPPSPAGCSAALVSRFPALLARHDLPPKKGYSTTVQPLVGCRLGCVAPTHETGYGTFSRHASSVRVGASADSFGLSPRKYLSFCKGRLSPFGYSL